MSARVQLTAVDNMYQVTSRAIGYGNPAKWPCGLEGTPLGLAGHFAWLLDARRFLSVVVAESKIVQAVLKRACTSHGFSSKGCERCPPPPTYKDASQDTNPAYCAPAQPSADIKVLYSWPVGLVRPSTLNKRCERYNVTARPARRLLQLDTGMRECAKKLSSRAKTTLNL